MQPYRIDHQQINVALDFDGVDEIQQTNKILKLKKNKNKKQKITYLDQYFNTTTIK